MSVRSRLLGNVLTAHRLLCQNDFDSITAAVTPIRRVDFWKQIRRIWMLSSRSNAELFHSISKIVKRILEYWNPRVCSSFTTRALKLSASGLICIKNGVKWNFKCDRLHFYYVRKERETIFQGYYTSKRIRICLHTADRWWWIRNSISIFFSCFIFLGVEPMKRARVCVCWTCVKELWAIVWMNEWKRACVFAMLLFRQNYLFEFQMRWMKLRQRNESGVFSLEPKTKADNLCLFFCF